jgi:hypothetical protein
MASSSSATPGPSTQRTLLPAPSASQDIVPFSYNSGDEIQQGLTLNQYGRYEVPWNGGITVSDWLAGFLKEEPRVQKAMADDWLISLTEYFDQTVAVISAAGTFFMGNEELMNLYGGVKNFKERYPIVQEIQNSRHKRLKEVTTAFKTIKTMDSKTLVEIINPYSSGVLHTHQGTTTIAFLLKRWQIEELAPYLNTQLYRRLQSRRKKKDLFLNTSDWAEVKDILHALKDNWLGFLKSNDPVAKAQCAKAMENGVNLPAYEAESAPFSRVIPGTTQSNTNYAILWRKAIDWYRTQEHRGTRETHTEEIPDEFLMQRKLMKDRRTGLIVPMNAAFGDDPARGERFKTVDSAVLEGMRSPTIGLNTGERTVLLDSDSIVSRKSLSPIESGFAKRRARSRTLSVSLSQASSRDVDSPGSTHSEQDELRRAEGNTVAIESAAIVRQLRSRIPRNTPPPPPRVRETRATAANRLQDRQGQLDAIDEDAEYEDAVDEEVEPRAKHTAATKAGCRCVDPESVLVKMMGKMTANKKLSDPTRVKLIDEYYRECHEPGKDYDRLCYNHLQFLASKMGLRTRTAGTKVLRETLDILYASKSQWGALQTDTVTGILFTAPFRGTRQHDDLKSYRYRPAKVRPVIEWDMLREEMEVQGEYNQFKETGTTIFDTFRWVTEDKELMGIITEAYDMYEYHTRRIDGNSNLGWCRVMYHSIVQQLVRGDPEYWLQYAMLREETNLISYPYYTKYTRPGDATAFRHIDLNIAKVVTTGLGVDAIQGSVSWDDEDEDNCTEMFEGFHLIISEYLEWRRSANMNDASSKIEAWKAKEHWPEELEKRFPDVQWKKIVCKTGQVRISDPRVPHGSTGPATKVRRTMLPWFVKVHDDMMTMEIPEMGSYDEIAMAHQKLTAAPKTPSGHANMYGGIKWAFPGDVNPTYTSPIVRAVNCQLRWDSPLVISELRELFSNPSYKPIMSWIWRTREATVNMLKAHWEITKQMERDAYGPDEEHGVPDRSFFSNRGKHPARGAEWWEYDGEVDMTTALDQLRQELSMSREEAVFRDETGTPLRTPQHGQSPRQRGTGSLTPTSQLSDISHREGSPMDVDEEEDGAMASHQRRSSRIEQLRNEWEVSTGSPQKGKGKGRRA